MTETGSVKRSIWIDAPLDKVWRALTEKQELLRWYTWDCEIDFREGGTGKYNHGWGAWSSGTFEDIVEKERFVLRTDDNSRTITTLTPENNGVTVTIEYQIPGLENEHTMKENMAFGTYQFMKNLKSVLENDRDLRPAFWKSWIGVRHTSVRPEDGLEQGSLVLSVEEGTPADEAGLKKGDVITGVNGKTVRSYEDFESTVTPMKVNEPLLLSISRNDEVKEISCPSARFPREYRTEVEWWA